MHVREIPHQVFTAMTEGKVTETHDLHEYLRPFGHSRSLDIYNYGPTVVTSKMDDHLWLRLSDENVGTSLEVVQSLSPDTGPPIDHPHVHNSRNNAIFKSLAKLYAGETRQYMSENQVQQTVLMHYSLGDMNYRIPIEAEPVLMGSRLAIEMAERAFIMLHSVKGRYDLSTYYLDEITPTAPEH